MKSTMSAAWRTCAMTESLRSEKAMIVISSVSVVGTSQCDCYAQRESLRDSFTTHR